jgi:tetratricopeptide (TPR) repeat protein
MGHALLTLIALIFLAACETKLMREQAEQIRQQEQELARQRQEIETLKLTQQQETEKREACNRAFRDFEQAQSTKDPGVAVALYRKGLALCPDDDVAHYELAKVLVELGQVKEARSEFEAALKINPNFTAAKAAREGLQGKN